MLLEVQREIQGEPTLDDYISAFSVLLLYFQYLAVILVDDIDLGLWGELVSWVKIFGDLVDIGKATPTRGMYYFLLISITLYPIAIIFSIRSFAHSTDIKSLHSFDRCSLYLYSIGLLISLTFGFIFITEDETFDKGIIILIGSAYSILLFLHLIALRDIVNSVVMIQILRAILVFLYVPLASFLSSIVVLFKTEDQIFEEFATVAILTFSGLLGYIFLFEIRFILSLVPEKSGMGSVTRFFEYLSDKGVRSIFWLVIFLPLFIIYLISLLAAAICLILSYFFYVFLTCACYCCDFYYGAPWFGYEFREYLFEDEFFETFPFTIATSLAFNDKYCCTKIGSACSNGFTNFLCFLTCFPFSKEHAKFISESVKNETRPDAWPLGIYFLIERLGMALIGGILGSQQFREATGIGATEEEGAEFPIYAFISLLGLSVILIIIYEPFSTDYMNILQLCPRVAHFFLLFIVLVRNTTTFTLFQVLLFLFISFPMFLFWILFLNPPKLLGLIAAKTAETRNSIKTIRGTVKEEGNTGIDIRDVATRV